MQSLKLVNEIIIATSDSGEQFVVPLSQFPGGTFSDTSIKIGTATIGIPSIIEIAKNTTCIIEKSRIIACCGKIFDIINFLKTKNIYLGNDQIIPKDIFSSFKIYDKKIRYNEIETTNPPICEPQNYIFERIKYCYTEPRISPVNKQLTENEIEKLIRKNYPILDEERIKFGSFWIYSNTSDHRIYYGHIIDLLKSSEVKIDPPKPIEEKFKPPTDELVGYYYSKPILITVHSSGKIIYNSSAPEQLPEISTTCENIISSFNGKEIGLNCSGKIRTIHLASIKNVIINSMDSELIFVIEENGELKSIRTITTYFDENGLMIRNNILIAIKKQNFNFF